MAVSKFYQSFMEAYEEIRVPSMFLSSRFKLRKGNVFETEKVVLDIQRFGETVAPVVTKYASANMNDFNKFETKEIQPPKYSEGFALDALDMYNRIAGESPEANSSLRAKFLAKTMTGMREAEYKIQRSLELQAAQALTTGTITLDGALGSAKYSIDFGKRTEHFPTVSTAWSVSATCTPLDDINVLATMIRKNGKIVPNRLTMSSSAMTNFLNSAQVRDHLDNRRLEMGLIDPTAMAADATYHGRMWIGAYQYDLWSYPEFYENASGVMTEYLAGDKCVIDSDKTRLDKLVAVVPKPIIMNPQLRAMIPARMTSTSGGYDITPNIYASNNGMELKAELYSSTLCATTQIDGFGCITTEV